MMNGVGGFPVFTPRPTPGYNPVYGPGYGPDNAPGMNNDPAMQRPGGDYTGPDAQGNFPEVEEPIIAPSTAEEQEFGNPFSGMFGDGTSRGSELHDDDEKMAKYQDSFLRRISQLEGGEALGTFLDAVRNSDTEVAEHVLKDKDPSSPAKNEENLRAALIIAIKSRHIEMVKMLLEHKAPIGNAFFHAVDGSSTPVVKVLCDHLKGKKAMVDSAVNSFSEDPEFPTTTTPLMMAASENEHEICELLIGIGAELPTLEDTLARVGSSRDIYERALTRLHWHKAMSSEAYLLFSSPDPIQAAFEAGLKIEETRKDQLTHIKPEYKELKQTLDKFLTNYLEMIQNTTEIATMLSGEEASNNNNSNNNNKDNNKSTKSLPVRLLYAIDLKFKSFIAHNNCQQYILDRWYLYHQEWEELPMSHFVLRTALIFILMPLLCVIYIIFPLMWVKRFMKMPFVCFVLQMSSRIAFLLILLYSTIQSASDKKIAASGGEDAPTRSPEEYNKARIEHYLEYRGCPAHMGVWLIYVWIVGMTWRELKELWRQGFKEYLAEAFNWVDIIQLIFYWISLILNFISYLAALKKIRSPGWESWDSCSVDIDEEDGDELGSETHLFVVEEKGPEDPRAVHAKFECEDRTDWNPYDPLLVAEGCFALATVLTFLGALRDTVILSFVGPLRISLGGMIVDIIRFFVIFFFLWVSFSIGLTQLYETFCVLEVLKCEAGEDCHPAFLSFYSTMGTLFWSLFDLADTEELEVDPSAGMVFTEGVGLFLYAAYLVIAVVVMLNALIAMMSNTYTRVEENAELEWKVERTKLMVDYMVNCPTMPPPFNLVPTPKSFVRLFTRCYKCCFLRSSTKRKKLDRERDRSVREKQYKLFIQNLTDRYINDLKSRQLDDDSERLYMDLSTLKETLRMMRNQMRDIQSANTRTHKNVEACVHGLSDMMERQKRLEEEQKRQGELLTNAPLPPSGLPSPPPVSPQPPRREPGESIRPKKRSR
ncbi:short transient receptor potential channel 1-like isoform X3 [Amphiura filiformis]|uniref:short transient receptor potential channel 1-like isoform X3 n=1 Tax=Amphiura filiformis TaxID=82378 RepID=UPI003B223A04